MQSKKDWPSRLREGDWPLWPLVTLFLLSCAAVRWARKQDAAKYAK